MLAKLIENIKLRETKNIKSGFRATGIWPLNPINVTKRIPELYDEVKYGIDNALLEYLKETRSPNPMTVKRTKKLKTEPGKSVCVEDISIKANNTKKTNATNKNKKHINTEEDIVIPMLNENTEEKIETDEEIETYILHEETGQIVKKNSKKSRVSLVSSAVTQITQNDSPSTSTENDSRNELVVPLSLLYNPNSLKAICIDIVTSLSSPKKFVTSDEKVTSTAKITSTRKKENIKKKFLGAETIRDSALQKKSNAKQDNILKEIEINNVQPKTSNKIQNRKRKSKKKKRKLDRYVVESSSENSDIMSVVDTENSESESMKDFIKKYLLEEDYKEEFKEDYTEDVSFFTGNPSNIKKDDWILIS
ncbi:unnamed protein product [Parnassius apollo]|uniref:(apollo) hypothetical protein n=1 Tax=Parnassius apollo TaxID=110799 RepID=A0A8S3X3M4_PARAO|nr:unnamed protein product [Parnassius apollo]